MANPCELDDCIEPSVHDRRLLYKLLPLLLLGLLAFLLSRCGALNTTATTTAPRDYVIPTFTTPANGSTLDVGSATINGTGEAGEFLNLYRNGNLLSAVKIGNDGKWSYNHVFTDPGEYEFTARHINGGGDTINESSGHYLLSVGGFAPLTIGAPALGDFTLSANDMAQGDIQWTGTAQPNTRVHLFANEHPVGSTDVDGNGDWSLDSDVRLALDSYDVRGTMVNGDRVVLSNATGDGFTLSTANVTRVLTAPTITDAAADGGSITVNGQGTPGSTVEVWANGVLWQTVTVGSDGKWSATAPAEAGDYTFTAHTLGDDGTASDDSRSVTVVIENAGTPDDGSGSEEIVAPTTDTIAHENGNLTLSGTGTPGATVEIWANGALWQTVTVGDDGNWTVTAPADPGDYNFIARTLDASGDVVAESDSQPFTVTTPDTDASTGTLVVTFGGGTGSGGDGNGTLLAGRPTVEIVLDASWSMRNSVLPQNSPIPRMDIAHNGVTDVVNNLIPEGTVVALRGFGHIEGNLACRTALEYPAQALDRDSFLAASNRIEPKFNANTPIAESLLGVQSDLADIPGPKIIILLTDGNETCGGDVAGAIEALVSGGFDVRIDVVGIGIDDDALRSEFEGWAEAGGGVYYDAPDSDSITTAMADIFSRGLPTPFQVLDSDGTLVQQGLANGDPISLPVGDYTVQVLTSPLESFDITVTEGEETAISVE